MNLRFLFLAFLLTACTMAVDVTVPDIRHWEASWIGAPWEGETYRADTLLSAPEFRKDFVLEGKVKRATAHISGLGFFELYVNGKKIGDEVLTPNETSYGHRPSLPYQKHGIPVDDTHWRAFRVFYLNYDITEALREGENTLGVVLGNGFFASGQRRWVAPYGTPRLICQVDLEYAGGRKETVVSDTSWRVRQSPIVMNDLFEGEIYDARRENAGEWEAAVLRKAPDGKLCLQDGPPDKVMEVLEPVSIVHGPDGRWEVDFGDYVTGWVRLLDFEAPEGRVITVEHPVEGKDYNGIYKYICAGGPVASYAPRFCWWTFRKVVVWGWPGTLKAENIRAEVVHSDIRESARFDCSHPLLVKINEIWKRTQTDNMHLGVATDCPHREKGPYTGDGQVACVTVMHNFDANRFYRKWLRDMSDCQDTETGYVPNGAPWHPGCGGGVPWGAAMTLMPWEHYLHYGDISVLQEHYEAMALQLRYMESWRTEEGIMYQQMPSRDNPFYWNNLGEWCPAYNLPSDALVHTYFLWKCARYMALSAGALGKEADEARYEALAEEVREAFHRVFYHQEAESYGDNDGANFFALHMGVPEERREAVLNTVKREFEANGGHLNTGIFGTQLFFDMLCEYGLGEMAFTAMTQTDYPSYGHWIEQGADTFWEQWDGEASRNHPMFGGGISWMYTHLAGLQADPLEPGYRHILVKPLPLGDLEWVSYETETPQGVVAVHWERKDRIFRLTLQVPEGSHASVWMPASESPVKLQSGRHTLETPLDARDRLITNIR